MPERPEDARLLAELAEALRSQSAAPPPEGIAALHAAVDRRAMGEPVLPRPTGAGVWERLAGLRWRRPAGVAAIVAGSLVAGGGVAFAAGAPLPPPVRELATHLGLPVTPQPVVNVHNTESRLSRALERSSGGGAGTSGTANSVVAHYAGTLRRQVSQLSPSEQKAEDPRAEHLLDQAARQDGQPDSTPAAGRDGGGHANPGESGGGSGGQGSGDRHGSGASGGGSGGGGSDSNSYRSGGGDSQQSGRSQQGSAGFSYEGTRYASNTSALPHDAGHGADQGGGD